MFGKKIEHKQLFDLIFKGVIILYIILSTVFGFIVDYNSLGIFTNWWLLFIGVVFLVINSLITIIHFKRLSLPFVINSLLNLSLAILIYFLYQSVV
ncbi:hypothetical protein GCM10008932_10660 [Alkalibacterium iburiense]|uniref:Uncharacterized protein n=1 Tax=Alkalibacterium iburiense TaxID=290589 RepID=A0ABN0XBE1_9LACT